MQACTKSGGGKASLPPKGEVAAVVTPPAPPVTAEPAVEPAVEPAAAEPAAAAPQVEPGTTVAKSAPGTVAPQGSNVAIDYRLTGQVSAPRRSQLTFRVSGFISSVLLKAGTKAKQGEVIATLDDRDFQLRLELAKARRDSAAVQVATAEKEYQREQELKKANASTASNFDRIKSSYDVARVALRLAQLDLEQAELAYKDTKLTAPYDCVVSTQFKYDGESVQMAPPSPVVEVYDTGEPEVTLSAPERLMGQIQSGTKLKLTIPAAGFSGAGEVVRIVPVINERSRTFQVIAKFSSYDAKVAPGSYAEASVE
jgi:RND family efflux transporter MFP subunit